MHGRSRFCVCAAHIEAEGVTLSLTPTPAQTLALYVIRIKPNGTLNKEDHLCS